MLRCYPLKSSHPLLLLSPKVCSLRLCLLCCPACRIVRTEFCLYVLIYDTCFSFCLTSLCSTGFRFIHHLIRTDQRDAAYGGPSKPKFTSSPATGTSARPLLSAEGGRKEGETRPPGSWLWLQTLLVAPVKPWLRSMTLVSRESAGAPASPGADLGVPLAFPGAIHSISGSLLGTYCVSRNTLLTRCLQRAILY